MPDTLSLPALKLAMGGPPPNATAYAPLATVPKFVTWLDARWTTPTAGRFAEAYRANSCFHATIARISAAFIEPPLRAYELLADGTEVLAPASPLQTLLDHPTPDQGQREWLRTCMVYRAWGGNCYLNKIGNVGGTTVTELWPLSARVMGPACPDGTITTGYWHTADPAHPALIEKDRIVHWAGDPHPLRPWEGISPVEVLLREIDADDELARMLKAILQNDAVPRGILSLPPEANPDQDQIAAIKKAWHDALGRPSQPDPFWFQGYAGSAVSGVYPYGTASVSAMGTTSYDGDGRGGIAVLAGGATYSRTALNMQELGSKDIRHSLEARIHSIMGILPQVTGIEVGLEAGRYANFEEAFRAFITLTMIGHWLDFESTLNHELCPVFGPQWRVHFDTSKVRALAENEDAVWTRHGKAVHDGIETPNEARAAIILPPLPDPSADMLIGAPAQVTVTGVPQTGNETTPA